VDELRDELIMLRPWRLDEAGWDEARWYAEQVRDTQIQQYTSEPVGLSVEQVRTAILTYAEDPARPCWVIVAAGSGDLLGNAALNLVAGTVSYWVAASARGRGVATAAVRLMADYAFTVGGLTELRLWVKAGNQASARVAEKAGFLRTPELDTTVSVRGEQWPAQYYTRTRDSTSP
jgi:[ribosomal protein S5]-alanine N-acetyltransferase